MPCKSLKKIFAIMVIAMVAVASVESQITNPTGIRLPVKPMDTDAAETAEVIFELARIRGTPSPSGRVVAIIRQGEKIRLTNYNDSAGWYPVAFGRITGWIHGSAIRFISLDKPPSGRPATSVGIGEPEPVRPTAPVGTGEPKPVRPTAPPKIEGIHGESVPLKSAPTLRILDFTLGRPLKRMERCEAEAKVDGTQRYLFQCTILSYPVDVRGNYTDQILRFNYPMVGLLHLDKPEITARIINGNLEEISWYTNGLGEHEDVLLSLTDKFGNPTKQNQFPFADGDGQKRTGTYYEWRFTDLEVVYVNIFLDRKRGLIQISTPVSKALDEKEKRKPGEPKYKL